MSEALRNAGNKARAEIQPGIGHTGILASLMPGLRWRSPTLRQAEAFIAAPGQA